jgi:Uma2 family endonuclease
MDTESVAGEAAMSTAERPPRGGPIELADPPYWDPFDPRFPDSDGKPMADNQTQYKWMVTIAEGLDDLCRDRLDVLVACDLLWYFDRPNPRRCVAPDVFVAFGRPKAPRHSYKKWLEGRAPQVVFEIHSPSNTPAEMGRKLKLHDERGVEEYYYYYFPEEAAGRFDGWLRGPSGLEPIASTDGWASPRLGVTFETPPVDDALVLRGPDGAPFQHVQDIMKDRRLARRVAEIERRRRKAEARSLDADLAAREERGRREQAERQAREAVERAERFAAKLREMGVEPDQP